MWVDRACDQFVADVYHSGGVFDAVALHPYGQPGSVPNSIHWAALDETRAVMVAHGDSRKSIIVNEFGWSTSDEKFKAQALEAALTGLASPHYGYVSVSLYLALTDLPGQPGTRVPVRHRVAM